LRQDTGGGKVHKTEGLKSERTTGVRPGEGKGSTEEKGCRRWRLLFHPCDEADDYPRLFREREQNGGEKANSSGREVIGGKKEITDWGEKKRGGPPRQLPI